MLMSTAWIFLLLQALASSVQAERARICYYTNWSQYRQGSIARFEPLHIDPFLCTHIAFAFGRVNPDTNSIEPTQWNDWQNYRDVVSMKTINPKLKVLLAVGGYNHGPVPFNNVASSFTRTDMFAENTIRLLRDAGMDGLDVDWEWPDENSRLQFVSFIQRLRMAFDQEAQTTGKERLILTVATSAAENSISAYGPASIASYVDYVLVMAYDMFNTWALQLAHHSPLYLRPQDIDHPHLGANSQNKSMYAWLRAGIPKEKLVMGMSSYGRGVRLNSAPFHNIGDFYSRQLASAGPYTKMDGILSYYEICQKLNNGWNRLYVKESEVPTAWNSTTLDWTGYDDEESYTAKAKYIVEHDFGGAMVWSLDFDDFTAEGCNNGKYPLISQIKRVFEEDDATKTTESSEAVSTTRKEMTTTAEKPSTSSTSTTTSATTSTTETTTTTTKPTTTTTTTTTSKPTTTKSSTTARTAAAAVETTSTTSTTSTQRPTTQPPTTATTTTTTTAAPQLTCANAFGWYRDPADCSFFYRCVWSKPFHLGCPQNLRFNLAILACDWAWNVQCD